MPTVVLSAKNPHGEVPVALKPPPTPEAVNAPLLPDESVRIAENVSVPAMVALVVSPNNVCVAAGNVYVYAPGTVKFQLYAPLVVRVEPDASVSVVVDAGLVNTKFEIELPFSWLALMAPVPIGFSKPAEVI